jgi:hypothetical protein
MIWTHPARALPTSALTAAAVCAGAFDAGARSAPQEVAVATTAMPAESPSAAGLSPRLLADAAAYQAYLDRATATPANFSNAQSVSVALKTVAAYEVKALIRGAIAYGAVAALDDPTFVASVRTAGASPENRRLILSYLAADPAYALMYKGADGAAGFAQQAIGAAGLQLYAAGKSVKLSAYSIQHQAWSKQDIPDRPGRLNAVEAEGESALQPADDRIPALQRAASGTQPLPISAAPAQPPYTPLVARSVQLAAMAALGEAGDDAYDRLTSLTVDETTHTCLHIAKLNLYQCLAVAKPNYEDVFCMGQHVMMDTGSCLVRNVGLSMPVETAAAPPPAAPTSSKKSKRGGGG